MNFRSLGSEPSALAKLSYSPNMVTTAGVEPASSYENSNLLILCCAACSQCNGCSASLHLITPKTKTRACFAWLAMIRNETGYEEASVLLTSRSGSSIIVGLKEASLQRVAEKSSAAESVPGKFRLLLCTHGCLSSVAISMKFVFRKPCGCQGRRHWRRGWCEFRTSAASGIGFFGSCRNRPEWRRFSPALTYPVL